MTTRQKWLPVPGFEERYEVSDGGQVRSVGLYVNNRWGTRTWLPGKMLTGSQHSYGHIYVALRDADGHQRVVPVHRLVLQAFVGDPPPGKPNGLHRNDIPTDNRLINLYWGDRAENGRDSVRNGNHVQARKQVCGLGHQLVAPNLVNTPGARGCLACHMSQVNHRHDAKLGRPRTRYNRSKDGFRRQPGETWQQEANRRYAHIMGQAA